MREPPHRAPKKSWIFRIFKSDPTWHDITLHFYCWISQLYQNKIVCKKNRRPTTGARGCDFLTSLEQFRMIGYLLISLAIPNHLGPSLSSIKYYGARRSRRQQVIDIWNFSVIPFLPSLAQAPTPAKPDWVGFILS